MPASTPLPSRRTSAPNTVLCAVLAGSLLLTACAGPEVTMPDLRGKTCTYYATKIDELRGTVARKEVEGQAEGAIAFAAAVGLSLIVPGLGLATIPAEQEARRDNVQAQSDLWTYRAAYEARDC